MTELPEEDDFVVDVLHLVDGTILIGEYAGADEHGVYLRNTFIMTKYRTALSMDSDNLDTSIRVLLTKYDSFNNQPDTVVRIFKGGIISTYSADDRIVEFYKEFVEIQTENLTDEQPKPTMADDIAKLLMEGDGQDIADFKSSIVRLPRDDADEE